MKTAVLMTCHNRKDTTLGCLERLMPQLAADDKVFLVDDGSNDRTGAAVRERFPKISVIDGDGTLYWSKGMRKAWEHSLTDGEWDGWLWLNDDTMLDGDALEEILECVAESGGKVVLGPLRDEESGARIYGAGTEGLFTGNCTYVPRNVFERVGMISGAYHHAWGDYDYARKCRRSGVTWVETFDTVGTAKAHPIRPSLKGLSIKQRWRLLWNPKGWCLADLWTYRKRNDGLAMAVASCCHMALHVLLARA